MKNGKLSVLNLLLKSSFRVLKKSKFVLSQLGFLSLISTTLLLTSSIATNNLSRSLLKVNDNSIKPEFIVQELDVSDGEVYESIQVDQTPIFGYNNTLTANGYNLSNSTINQAPWLQQEVSNKFWYYLTQADVNGSNLFRNEYGQISSLLIWDNAELEKLTPYLSEVFSFFNKAIPSNNPQNQVISPLDILFDNNKNIVGVNPVSGAQILGVNPSNIVSIQHSIIDIRSPDQSNISPFYNSKNSKYEYFLNVPGSIELFFDNNIANREKFYNTKKYSPIVKKTVEELFFNLSSQPSAKVDFKNYLLFLDTNKLKNKYKFFYDLVFNPNNDPELSSFLTSINKQIQPKIGDLSGIDLDNINWNLLSAEQLNTIKYFKTYVKLTNDNEFVLNNAKNYLWNELNKTIDLVLDPEQSWNLVENSPLNYYLNKYTTEGILKNNNVIYSKISNSYNADSIFVNYDVSSEINKLVLYEGNPLSNANLEKSKLIYDKIKELIYSYVIFYWPYNIPTYEQYIAIKPWEAFNFLLEFDIKSSNEEDAIAINKALELGTKIPASAQDYNDNFISDGGYLDIMYKSFMVSDVNLVDGMIQVQFFKKTALGPIPILAKWEDTSSFEIILNPISYNQNNKSFIDINFYKLALLLPYKDYLTTPESAGINAPNDPEAAAHFIFNPYTNKVEYFQDFNDWLQKIPSNVKTKIGSQDFVILGSGITSDLSYPATSENSLFINPTGSNIYYSNLLGYNKLSPHAFNNSEITYFSVNFPSNISIINKLDFIKKLNTDIKEYVTSSNEGLLYKTNDPNQANNLLYIRFNFLNSLNLIMNTILWVICGITCFLIFFFIGSLTRFLMKSTKQMLGVCLANGISKLNLSISFIPFAALPAIFAGVFGYLFAFLLQTPINAILSNYWTIPLHTTSIYWFLFLLLPIIIFVILYLSIIGICYWTLRKPTSDIMYKSSIFRMNKLIEVTKPAIRRLRPLTSFRLTYMMGNIFRFIVLTFISSAFISMVSITVGSLNTFTNSVIQTANIKNYEFSSDLYSPTAQGGFYNVMPYNEIGISQNGFDSLYNQNSPYLKPDKLSHLAYPYSSDLKYFTSLFMPTFDVVAKIQWDPQFFKNSILTKLTLDANVSVPGSQLNVWLFAESAFPPSVLNLANTKFNDLVQLNIDFYHYLETSNDKEINFENYYASMIHNKPKTTNYNPINIDGSHFKLDLENNIILDPDKSIFIFNENTNNYTINSNISIEPFPNISFINQACRVVVYLLTNYQNPVFIKYLNDVLKIDINTGNINNNLAAGLGIISLDKNPNGKHDSTYTYLTSKLLKINNKNKTDDIKIIGINPLDNPLNNEPIINLFSASNPNVTLNDLLSKKTIGGYYPLVINEVAAKKLHIKTGDIINVDVTNHYERFIRKFNGTNPNENVNFQVVGVVRSKSEFLYYTNQTYANEILGFNKYKSEYENMIMPDGSKYIPFNGVFSTINLPYLPNLFFNLIPFYSPTGITTTYVKLDINSTSGDSFWLINNTLPKLNDILKFNLTSKLDEIGAHDFVSIYKAIISILNDIFYDNADQTSFATMFPAITSIDAKTINILAGVSIDGLLVSIEALVILSLLPTLLIIIILITSILVSESKQLISILKVLGFGDSSNALTFSFIYIFVALFGLLFSLPITYGILGILSYWSFISFNIIINPVSPWWTYLSSFAIISFIFYFGYLFIKNKMKKINLAKSISFLQ